MRPPGDNPNIRHLQTTIRPWGRLGCLGALGVGLLLAAVAFGIAGWNTVDSGNVAVTRRFGQIEGVRGAGGFWAQPIGFSLVEYDLRVVSGLEGEKASLANQQTLNINRVAYQYNLTPEAARQLLEQVGTQETFESRVVIPKLLNAIKIVTPRFTWDKVFPQRGQMEQEIERALAADLADYRIAPGSIDVTLADIGFDPEFSRSIDAKAKAEQDRLVELANLEKQKIRNEQELQQARTDAEKARVAAIGQANATKETASGEAAATLVRAKAEADGNTLVRETLTPALIQYRYAQNWNGQLPTTMLGQGTDVLAPLPGSTTEQPQAGVQPRR